MERLSNILRKKYNQPRFKEALYFGKLKTAVEKFFLAKKLAVNCIEFDKDKKCVTLKTKHPVEAREAIGYQSELNKVLKQKQLAAVTIKTKSV